MRKHLLLLIRIEHRIVPPYVKKDSTKSEKKTFVNLLENFVYNKALPHR